MNDNRPAYVGIILKKNNSVFLIQRCNTNWMSGYWNFPGGLVEPNETTLNAVAREAQEEIGVVVQQCELLHVLNVYKNESNTQDITGYYFKVVDWEGVPRNNEPDKIVDAQWFPLDSLPTTITEHALIAIDALKTGKTTSEHGREK